MKSKTATPVPTAVRTPLRKIMAKISDLDMSICVRLKLDQDRVHYLAALIVDDKKLPAIWINESGVVIAGRHRIAAHQYLELTEIEAEVFAIEDEAEIILMGHNENGNGSMPYNTGDIQFNIEQLIVRGISEKQIVAGLQLPPTQARDWIRNVRARLTTKHLQAAATAVATKEYTVARAAEEFNVDIDLLRKFISGERRDNRSSNFKTVKGRTISKGRSHSATMAKTCKRLVEGYGDGDFTQDQVDELFALMLNQTRQMQRFLADWKSRFVSRTKVAV